MARRDPRAITALVLLPLLLSGCMSSADLLCGIIVAVPLVHLPILLLVALLEHLRRLPGCSLRSLLLPGFLSTSALAGLCAYVFRLSGQDLDLELVKVAWIGLGAAGLVIAMLAWRVRQKASCVSRVFVATFLGTLPGLPALVLWPPSVSGSGPAVFYLLGVTLLGLMTLGGYTPPVVYLGLAYEAYQARKKEELSAR